MIDIIGKRRWYFIFAGVLIVACIIFLAVFGLKAGVEFSSGSVMTVDFEQQVEKVDLENKLNELGYTSVIIQEVGEDAFLVRLPRVTAAEKTALETDLSEEFESLVVREFDDVSEMVASETTRNAGFAVAVATIGILLYIAWAFRRMPHPFHYGVCAIIALIHDTLVALGVFAVLGGVFGWEIDLKFVIGILAVIGYSVNNTVVVFDRIRENLLTDSRSSFATVVNNSLLETLTRSINTSLTTLFVVLALVLFVGTVIQNFAAILLVGIIAGTYSSLFVAPSLLVLWRGDRQS
ncbi:MAG: protein translocase subunit SecF [Dehalococcoidales bacterium]|nr:MAG: protein translocase subunit SecF [Dehalococcoidales bacterium]